MATPTAIAPYLRASFLWCWKNDMPCSTCGAYVSVFNSLGVILDTKTSGYYWKFHLSARRRAQANWGPMELAPAPAPVRVETPPHQTSAVQRARRRPLNKHGIVSEE